MNMSALPACMYVHSMFTTCPYGSGKNSVKFCEAIVMDGCKSAYGCYKLNSNPQQEQVFLPTQLVSNPNHSFLETALVIWAPCLLPSS